MFDDEVNSSIRDVNKEIADLRKRMWEVEDTILRLLEFLNIEKVYQPNTVFIKKEKSK